MESVISNLLTRFEKGSLSRRELVHGLAMLAASGTAVAAQEDLDFKAADIDHVADAPKFADKITEHGVTVVVDPKATMYIIGSVMDYKESPTHSGFDFTNPNETGRCGCGESFTVK